VWSTEIVESDDTDPRERSRQMHYIAADLDTDAWVEAGFARLEQYLILWQLFKDRYDDGSAWTERDADRRNPD
jgi:hypothetical protein